MRELGHDLPTTAVFRSAGTYKINNSLDGLSSDRAQSKKSQDPWRGDGVSPISGVRAAVWFRNQRRRGAVFHKLVSRKKKKKKKMSDDRKGQSCSGGLWRKK